ncbi:hypothetical protein INR49_021147 [Caranx melampygus]|nr:hypothetical protein INR49_021147 [Caranx melampygus]
MQPNQAKEARMADARAVAEQELRMTQSEFDRQAEIPAAARRRQQHPRTPLTLLERLCGGPDYVLCTVLPVHGGSPKAAGQFPSFTNNNQSAVSGGASISVPTIPVSASLPSVSAGRSSSAASGGFNELRSSNGSRKARVLYDYDAASSSELSLLADEVITVSSVPGMDSDWLMGERGNQKGKVPITYLELLN